MSVSFRMWKLGTTTALGATAFTLWSGPAFGFFPPIPVGSPPVTVLPPPPAPVVVVPPVSPEIPVVPPTTPTVPPLVVPPVPPPPFNPPVPPTVPPLVPPLTVPPPPQCVCVPPQTVPEPATLLSAAIGLGLAGGVAWKRRKNAEKKE